MDRDRRGRRRQPDQARGLRPLHPLLPPEWDSRAIRVAMSAEDWRRFESLVADEAYHAPSQPRAHGEAISRLIRGRGRSAPGPSDWMDWERQKMLRLLRKAN